MVFSCVIVLALLSFVTSTPHEYAAKTGAVAKAEANAVAGTFGVLPVIPLSIPSGSGFSRSFSKSSSSSFASSSSSASSNSYSFNSNNGIPGVGCLSSDCKSGEGNIPYSSNGSPNTQITHHSSEASAVAAAKASAESSSYFISDSNAPCQGSCKGLGGSTKCETGQCDRSSGTSSNSGSESGKHTLNSENQQKCLSGNCSPTKQQPDSISNSNDFEVNFDRNSKINNPSGYDETLQVNNGKPSSTLTPKCNSPNCDTFLPLTPSHNPQPFNPQKPTLLVTPNLRPTCTTHSCNTDSTVPNENNGKPSSYNVPILGMNPSFQNNVPYNPSMTPLTNIPPHTVFEPNCGSNGCTPNNAQENMGSDGSKTPKYSHFNFPASPPNGVKFGMPYQTQSNIPHSCNTPYCNHFPVPHQSMNPGWSITIKPNPITTPINHNVPNYNNMFGIGAGSTALYPGMPNMVQPNNYAHHNVPSYSEGPKGSLNIAVHPGLISTTKPNIVTVSDNRNGPKYTNGFGGPPGPVNAAVYPGTHITAKPVSNTPSTESQLPLYTGGFGGPSGSVTAAVPASTFTTSKPNLNTKPREETYNSGFGGSPGALATVSTMQHNKPAYTPINTAITLSTVPPNNFVQNNIVNPSGNVNLDNVQRPVNEKEKLPPYTGGFGGPSGLLKPNEYNMPSNLNSPTSVTPCTTFDCRKQSVSNENSKNAEASASALANAEAVAYSGGFGAPPGFLQPDKSKTVNNNSDFKGNNNNNQVNNEKTLTDNAAGNQQNSEIKKPVEGGNADLNDFIKQTDIADTQSPGSQNNKVGNSAAVNGNKQNNIDKEKEFNDYIQQANVAGAFANAGAQTSAVGASPSVHKNKHDNFDGNKMLEDYLAQANIADAVAGAGAQANVVDQDNFIGLTGLNSKQGSGCNNNCRWNSNGGLLAGASASAKSISNAGSWATGQSFASGAATAHAFAGASAKAGYGRR